MGYLTGDTLNENCLISFRLSDDLLVRGALLGAIYELANPDNWEQQGAKTPAEMASYFDVIAEAIDCNMDEIGTIIPHVRAELSDRWLWCDGSVYNRVDYPLLYAALHANMKIDADTFSVPDFRERFPRGADSDFYQTGDMDGENNHVLALNELPAHSHVFPNNTAGAETYLGRSTTPGNYVTTGASGSFSLLASTASSVAGESAPFNNQPAFFVCRWAIVAK